METANLHILSTYLKKWSYQDNRITLAFSYFTELGYGRNSVDMRINATQVMINDFLNNVVYKTKEIFSGTNEEAVDVKIKLASEAEVKSKLQLYFNRIVKEYNLNKRSHGRSRMISNRSMDFYYNDFEYESLDDSAKFYVHLNRGVNKINGDLWETAIEEIEKSLEFNPEDPIANRYMAHALTKSRQFEESIKYYEKYARMDNSMESLNELAKAYMKIEQYDKAKKIYAKMKKKDPSDLLAKAGEAQLAYMQRKPYLAKLDKIFAIDAIWLKNYLKEVWNYRIPEYKSDESIKWNAATASRYLGYERPFDLTKRAFNNELPCYFNSEKGTIRFVKEELENWVEISNKYNLDSEHHELYPDRLSEKELEIAKIPSDSKPKSKSKSSTKEEIVL